MLKHLMSILVALTGTTAMAIEEPPFTVETKNKDYEIRLYEKIIVAETSIQTTFDDAGNQAFRVLADFIFGNNKSQTKIAMTAPVTQQPKSEKIAMTAPVTMAKDGEGSYVVQFVMPESYTLETLPVPNDPRVTIRELPRRRVAVHRYSGSWSETNYLEELKAFRSNLERDKIQTIGEPILSRFNSPFALWFLRRNEIWLELAPSQNG